MAGYYQQHDSCEDLKIKNPLAVLFKENNRLKSAEIMEKLTALEKEYGGTVDLNLFIHSQILDFLGKGLNKCIHHEPSTSLMKVKSGLDEATMLRLIESTEKWRIARAYVITEDNKLYFYHEDTNPKLKEIPINETNF